MRRTSSARSFSLFAAVNDEELVSIAEDGKVRGLLAEFFIDPFALSVFDGDSGQRGRSPFPGQHGDHLVRRFCGVGDLLDGSF